MLAGYCGECGAMLEERSTLSPAVAASEAPEEPGSVPARCVRCGMRTFDAARCPSCAALQPLADGVADPWLSYLAHQYPDLLRSPRVIAEGLPYRRDLSGLMPPLLATMLLLPWAWFVTLWPMLLPAWRHTRFAQPDAGGILAWMAVLLILGPWIFLGYTALLQGLASLAGGLGTLERTTRALALLWLPGLCLAAGWVCLMRLSQLLLLRLGWLTPDFTFAPIPAVYLYALLPLLCAMASLLTLLVLVGYQAILLAELNRLPLGWSLALHLVLLVMLAGGLLGGRRLSLPTIPRTVMAGALAPSEGVASCSPSVV